MPVPGETGSPVKQQQQAQKTISTPTKVNQQQSMIKADTPNKQVGNMANSTNAVKQQPFTPVAQNKPIANNNQGGNTPKKGENNNGNPNKQMNNNNNNNNKQQQNNNNNNNKQQQNNNANKQQNNNNGNKQQNNNSNNNNGNKQQNNNSNNNNNNKIGQNNNKGNNQNQKNGNNNNNNNNNKQNVDNKAKFNQNNNHNNNNNNQNSNSNKQSFDKNKFFAAKNNSNNNLYLKQGDKYHNGNNFQTDNTLQAEKKFTGRCRLFCGNLPSDMNEDEFRELFKKYGETGECFINTQRSFGFIKLDTRINAEHAKQELDGTIFKGRTIRVRFATHGAAVKVKNLSPYISNEYLEQAFSMFGPVERAVVIVDDKGRATGEGIVEFERKPASVQCINKCQENCFILTSYPKPIVVEPLEQKDEEDGLPEKSIIKNSQFYAEREVSAHFAVNNSNEHALAMKWRELYELEKQIAEEGKRRIDQAREMLEFEIEQALIDNKTMQLKEDLRMKQEELQRIEDMRKGEFARRQEMDMRRAADEQQRQEQMMMMQNNQDMGNMNQRGRFQDQPMNKQQNQQALAGAMPNQQMGNNTNLRQGRGGNQNNINPNFNNNMNPNQPNQFPMDNNELNNLPPAQQQAIIAAQLSFAMAAAAQQGNLNMGNNGMFDNNGQQIPNNVNNNNFNGPNHNNMNNQGGHGRNDRKNNDKGQRDDQRGNNNSGRRQFDRRNNRGGNRDDSYPGYDTKRARY